MCVTLEHFGDILLTVGHFISRTHIFNLLDTCLLVEMQVVLIRKRRAGTECTWDERTKGALNGVWECVWR